MEVMIKFFPKVSKMERFLFKFDQIYKDNFMDSDKKDDEKTIEDYANEVYKPVFKK